MFAAPHGMNDPSFAKIRRALDDLAAGKPVVVVDDPDRENEGDLILAAEHATAQNIGFMIRHTSGIICVAMAEAELTSLDMPQMVSHNTDTKGTAFTVSVDATEGTTTGIGASERANTIRKLTDPTARPQDFRRPGHIFPLRARAGGVLHRAGHTEAGVDLCQLAGCVGPAALSEIVGDDGEPLRRQALRAFAAAHDLTTVFISELIRYRHTGAGQDFEARVQCA